jgi:hypothetical protein
MTVLTNVLLKEPLIFLLLLGGDGGTLHCHASHCAESISTAAGACTPGHTLSVILLTDNCIVGVIQALVSGWVDFEMVEVQTAEWSRSVWFFFR